MLKIRIRRQATLSERVITRMAQVEGSIAALENEDLLDLADIFRNQLTNPVAEAAFVEMARRNISL